MVPTKEPIIRKMDSKGQFCLPRFESVMNIQGFTYDQLSREMGCDVKHYATGKNPMPLNLLDKCCTFMECDKNYVLMISNDPCCKPISPEPIPKKRKILEGRREFDFDRKIMLERIKEQGWALRVFGYNLCISYKFNCASQLDTINTVTNADYNNIMFLLKCDQDYLTGKSKTINENKIPTEFDTSFEGRKISINRCAISAIDFECLKSIMNAPDWYLKWLMEGTRILPETAGRHFSRIVWNKLYKSGKYANLGELYTPINFSKNSGKETKKAEEQTPAPVEEPAEPVKDYRGLDHIGDRIGTPIIEALTKAGIVVDGYENISGIPDNNATKQQHSANSYYASKHNSKNNYGSKWNKQNRMTMKDVLTFMETLTDDELDSLAEYAVAFKKIRSIKKNLLK